MGKVIAGFVVGFIVWTILWLGSDLLIVSFPTLAPSGDLEIIPTNYLLIKLASSVIFSIIAGLVAAWISGETTKAPLILGIMLLIVGLMFQISQWKPIPVWYHLLFLALLLPMAILGGKLRKI